jgi:hypothetical protein
MHRTVRTAMLSLAAVALVGGPAYRVGVAPRLARLPVDIHQRQVAEGSGVYLDPDRRFQVFGPVRLRNVHELRGIPGAGTSSVAVWSTHDQFFDLDRKRKLDDSTARYALDRRTARAVNCCGTDQDRHGSLAQAFPLGTRQTSYPWWDGTAERSYVARFVGAASLQGIRLYRFRVSVAPIVIDRITLPPEALDRSGSSPVPLDWWYRSQTDLLVEPASGVIVKGSQVADQWLANRAGARRLTVATTSLVDTPQTIDRNLRVASDLRASLIARTVWPVVLGPLLALALVAAVLVRSELSART